MNKPLKPFLQWFGGKSRLISTLDKYLPSNIKELDTYIEPFLGSGAMFFHILNNYPNIQTFYLNDKNFDVYNVWNILSSQHVEFCVILQGMTSIYKNMIQRNQKDYYLQIRGEFNYLLKHEHPLQRAVRMVFLNKTGFNGLYRVNREGKYNVSFGKNPNVQTFDLQNIIGIHDVLEDKDGFPPVSLSCKDFRDIDIDVYNSFVYLDPPYRPLSKTSNFTSYDGTTFTDKDQTDLANMLLNCKHAKVMESNSDPKNSSDTDSFFDDLFKDVFINSTQVNRNVAGDSTKRGKVSELIITNYNDFQGV